VSAEQTPTTGISGTLQVLRTNGLARGSSTPVAQALSQDVPVDVARPWRGRPAYCFRAEAASGTLWKANLGARVGRDTAAAWPPYRAKAFN
jgi:hypothetical protein